MIYNLNGTSYKSVMITEEEKAVVEAMRKGAEVELWVDFENKEDAKKYAYGFPFSKVASGTNHTDTLQSNLFYVVGNEKISIYTKKATQPASNE